MESERRKAWHESMEDIWEALGYVILFCGLVFGVTHCKRCEHEERMSEVEYQRAQKAEEQR